MQAIVYKTNNKNRNDQKLLLACVIAETNAKMRDKPSIKQKYIQQS